jgi:hypothetical protein
MADGDAQAVDRGLTAANAVDLNDVRMLCL